MIDAIKRRVEVMILLQESPVWWKRVKKIASKMVFFAFSCELGE